MNFGGTKKNLVAPCGPKRYQEEKARYILPEDFLGGIWLASGQQSFVSSMKLIVSEPVLPAHDFIEEKRERRAAS